MSSILGSLFNAQKLKNPEQPKKVIHLINKVISLDSEHQSGLRNLPNSVILWNFTTKKHKVDDYILILCAFFHRIHIQNTGFWLLTKIK